jgi:hypothetical protein
MAPFASRNRRATFSNPGPEKTNAANSVERLFKL